jgi:hypothetical protein
VSERRDRYDPELAELFGDDPGLLELAQRVRESRPEPDLDPRFPAILRARLMEEARAALTPERASGPAAAPRRGLRPRFHLGGLAAWGTLAVGAAVAAAAVVAIVSLRAPAPGGLAVVASNVSHKQAVDPHQAITLSFNQPMDEQNQQSVLAAVKIQPATQVTVAWKTPETLVITPVHPLAADTDYQVTIPKTSLQSQDGQTLTADVTIDFGTQPATPLGPSASPAPVLEPAVVGPAASDGQAFWGPAGAPGVTDESAGQATTVTIPAATASASPTGSPTPSATPTGSPPVGSPASSATPANAEGAVIFPDGQAPVALSATGAAAVAVSPDGFNIALALTGSDGSGQIVVEGDDGSQPNQVWTSGSAPGSAATALAWDGNNRIVFVTSAGIYAVNVSNEHVEQLLEFPAGGTASGVLLAPNGEYAFVPASDMAGQPGSTSTATPASTAATATPTPTSTPTGDSASASASPVATPSSTYIPSAADGWLVTLPTAAGQIPSPTQLAGSSSGVAAFSGAGDEIGWVDAGDEAEVAMVLEAPVSDPSAIVDVPGAPTEAIESLALDTHGATLAYGLDPGGIEVETAGGVVLGSTADVAQSLAFSPDGTRLAFVAAGSLDVAEVQPGSTTSSATSVCVGADQALSRFVDDQVSHDATGLAALVAPGTPSAVQLTPAAVDRGYVISSECASGSGASGPTLTASARLIVDPTRTSAGQLTDETVVLGQSQGQWLVTSLSVPPLRAQGSGPHVLTVSVTPPAKGALNPESVVTITFDADLDPSSLTTGSLWLETSGGQTIPLLAPVAYDPDTREVILTVSGAVPAGSEVVVGTAISDIDGGHPPAQTLYPVGS